MARKKKYPKLPNGYGSIKKLSGKRRNPYGVYPPGSDRPRKHSSLELILSLFHQMYAYAEKFELCEKDYSVHVKIKKAEDDEHGVPFSEDELAILWQHKEDPVVEFLLIMCYSGYLSKQDV